MQAAATREAPGTATAGAVPFADFMLVLRRNGFSVGLGHYARMMTVLEHTGPGCAPQQLRTLLCPVFATTAEQQDRFYRLFDQWFPALVMPVELAAAGPGATDDVAVQPVRRGAAPRRRPWLKWAAAASVLVVAVAVWQVGRPGSVQPDSQRLGADTAGQVQVQVQVQDQVQARPGPDPLPPPPPPVAKSLLQRPLVRNGLLLLLVAAFFGIEALQYRRRRVVVERQRRERPPLVWPLRVDATASPLVESADFFIAARRLRERQTGERSHLDVDQTIRATINALGFPTFKYVLETRPPEYLLLIERVATRDHQSNLYQHLADSLANEGVHVTSYCYDDDPRVCEPVAGGPAVLLSELRRRYPTSRLFIFGTGDGLVDPITGRRKPWVTDGLGWPDRALFTPEPPAGWGARELALASHFVVLPATVAGLQAAIDHFQLPTQQLINTKRGQLAFKSHVPELSGNDHVRILRHYVGERGLQWVCACAVYPELQWRLTLHLGMLPEVSGGAMDDDLLLRLVRLPWFRSGVIPDEARTVLLRVIKPEVERAARSAVLALLERNPAPAESVASTRYELDLVVQKIALFGGARAKRRDVERAARTVPRDKVAREIAVLRLVEQDPATRLVMQLPSRFRSVFFHNGLPVLGMTTGARSAVAMALASVVLLAGREQPASVSAQMASTTTGGASAAAANPAAPIPTKQADSLARAAALGARTNAAPVMPAASVPTPTQAARAEERALAAISPAERLTALRADLQSAIRDYEALQVERAVATLNRVVVRAGELTALEAAAAFKHLGAGHAIMARRDTAEALFARAIVLDPFTELDPRQFSQTEVGAFNAAKARTFRVGLRQPVLDGDSLYRVSIVTTHRANAVVDATNVTTSAAEILFSGSNDGIRDIMVPTRPARLTPGQWLVRITATSDLLSGVIDSARQLITVAPTVALSPAHVRIGSADAAAFLYANDRIIGAVSAIQTFEIPAGPVRLTIRSTRCGPVTWDTTIAVEAGQTLPIGLRNCSVELTRRTQLVAAAIEQARPRVSGTWPRRDRAGAVRVAGHVVDFSTGASAAGAALAEVDVTAQVTFPNNCGAAACWRGAPGLDETVVVDGSAAFSWRTPFGQARRSTENVVLTFRHQNSVLTLTHIAVTQP